MPADLRRYRLGSWVLQSAVPLPELPPADADGEPQWTVLISRPRRATTARWFHHWLAPDGRRWLSFGCADGGYVLRVSRHATFRISVTARTITCEHPPRVPAFTLRHLLLNQIWPLALSVDRPVLHASAVVLPGGALVIAGPGGTGKSTLATALAVAGHPLLADDAVALEQAGDAWLAHPEYASVRLWPDAEAAVLGRSRRSTAAAHYTRKRRVSALGLLPVAPGPTPVRAVCLLDRQLQPQAEPSVRPLTPREAVIGLMALALQLDIRDAARQRRTLETLSLVAERVPVFALSGLPEPAGLASVLPALVSRLGAAAAGSLAAAGSHG